MRKNENESNLLPDGPEGNKMAQDTFSQSHSFLATQYQLVEALGGEKKTHSIWDIFF